MYDPPSPVQQEFSVVDKQGRTQLDPQIARAFLDNGSVRAPCQNLLQPCKGGVRIAVECQRCDMVPLVGSLTRNTVGGRRTGRQPVFPHPQIVRALPGATCKQTG